MHKKCAVAVRFGAQRPDAVLGVTVCLDAASRLGFGSAREAKKALGWCVSQFLQDGDGRFCVNRDAA